MKAIIIDDETGARNVIKTILQKCCPDVIVISEADSVRNGKKEIEKHTPDLVFLDIQLGNGTGFDLLKEFNQINFQVIFITAYDNYAIKAFKHSALDYILKPIDIKELVQAVEKAHLVSKRDNYELKINTLLSNASSTEKKIVLKTLDSLYITNSNEIIRCEADGNYTKVYLTSNKSILISKTLKEFDDLLSDLGFFRVHNAHLINVSYLKRVKRNARGGELFMNDGTSVPLAFSRKQELMALLESF